MVPRADRHWRSGLAEAALGAWLALSVFAWEHSAAERWYACGIGAAIVAVSLLAFTWVPRLRWANMGLAIALFLATVLTSHVTTGLALNHLIVSLAVLVVTFVPLVAFTEPTESWSVPPTPDV